MSASSEICDNCLLKRRWGCNTLYGETLNEVRQTGICGFAIVNDEESKGFQHATIIKTRLGIRIELKGEVRE